MRSAATARGSPSESRESSRVLASVVMSETVATKRMSNAQGGHGLAEQHNVSWAGSHTARI